MRKMYNAPFIKASSIIALKEFNIGVASKRKDPDDEWGGGRAKELNFVESDDQDMFADNLWGDMHN